MRITQLLPAVYIATLSCGEDPLNRCVRIHEERMRHMTTLYANRADSTITVTPNPRPSDSVWAAENCVGRNLR